MCMCMLGGGGARKGVCECKCILMFNATQWLTTAALFTAKWTAAEQHNTRTDRMCLG